MINDILQIYIGALVFAFALGSLVGLLVGYKIGTMKDER